MDILFAIFYGIVTLAMFIFLYQYYYKHREKYRDMPMLAVIFLCSAIWPFTTFLMVYFIIQELRK